MHPAPIFSWDDRSGMFAFVAERSFATRKLSQNKGAADRTGVITALAASPRDGDRALAALMKPE